MTGTHTPRAPERVGAGEPHSNYALIPYQPATPAEGKLRSSSLLAHSFDVLGVPAAADELCQASRDEMGLGGTAWGIKQVGDEVAWELYYYFHWDHVPLTFERVAGIIDRSPFDRTPLPPSPTSWYSVSFDLTAAQLQHGAPVDGWHVYATHHPAEPRTALSYAVTPGGLRFENVYYLFDPAQQREELTQYVASSAFGAGSDDEVRQVIWPELLDGDHVALAHKPTCEGIYYGGVDVDAFLAFLRRSGFAPWMTDHVAAHRDELDHLRFDVGFDWVWRAGRAELVKTGFYGVL